MLMPVLPGGWSVKDMLAHIGFWEQHAANTFRTLSAGQAPNERVNDDNLDEYNARAYRQYKDTPLDEVRAFEQSAYRDLLLLVETAPEADWFDPARFPWMEQEAYYLVEWNTYDHYAEHLEMMRGKF